MKIYHEISLDRFEGWSGAEDTLDRVIEAGKVDELEAILEDMYPDGIDETNLNDLLRFDSDTVFSWLGISDDDDDDEEEDEETEEDIDFDQSFDDWCDAQYNAHGCEKCPFYLCREDCAEHWDKLKEKSV